MDVHSVRKSLLNNRFQPPLRLTQAQLQRAKIVQGRGMRAETRDESRSDKV
jgi:hypothetical protein